MFNDLDQYRELQSYDWQYDSKTCTWRYWEEVVGANEMVRIRVDAPGVVSICSGATASGQSSVPSSVPFQSFDSTEKTQ